MSAHNQTLQLHGRERSSNLAKSVCQTHEMNERILLRVVPGSTNSTIAHPQKPAILFHERCMAAQHEQGCYEKHIFT